MAVNQRLRLRVYEWLERNLHRLLAPPCRLCGESPDATPEICENCREALPWLGHACTMCGESISDTAPRLCGRCLRQPPPWQQLVAPFAYTDPVAALIRGFKLEGDLAAGRVLADLLAQHLRASGVPLAPVLLPVPLHPRRLRARGFNQAAEIARRLPGAIRHRSLSRRTAGPHQRGHGIAERRRNVHDAFHVETALLPDHVALVDDVVTTGATAAAIATKLRRAGIARVDIYALAKTPRSQGPRARPKPPR